MWGLGFYLLFLLHAPVERHPGHVGTTEVYYNPQAQRVEVTQKLLANDVERALRKQAEGQVVLQGAERSDRLRAYYAERLILFVDGKKITLRHIREEEKEGDLWCYMVAESVSSFNRVRIINTLLVDYHPDQIHIVYVRKDRETISLELDAAQPEGEVLFEE